MCFLSAPAGSLTQGYFQKMAQHATRDENPWQWSRDFCEDLLIYKGLWPLQSPESLLLDFFSRGFLKEWLFRDSPRTTDALKENVIKEIRQIDSKTLGRSVDNTQCRIQIYRGADKSLARPTSRCILFDGENISFDASLVIRELEL